MEEGVGGRGRWLMLELGQMAILIDEQDETINHVEKQAEDTHRDLERGYVFCVLPSFPV